jgi:phasin
MDMNKTTATKHVSSPQTDAPRAIREMAEKGAAQTKETYEKMSAATSEAADLMKASCSTAPQGAQDYSNKFLEFAQANTNAAFDFAQKVCRVKSPSEFMELSTEHSKAQTQTLTEQSKALAELAQKIALGGARPLQEGVAKAFTRAA